MQILINSMSFKLNRRLKANNRLISKWLSSDEGPVDFGFEKDKVTFFVYYPSARESVAGHYEYNRKGHVTEYAFQVNNGQPISSFLFPLKSGAKRFRQHLNHLSYVMNNDENFKLYMLDGFSTGDCQRMAGYLGQLQGAAADGTAVNLSSVDTTDWCYS